MMYQTTQTMKKLTRIRLINWHYFSNETISVNGSFLISGENASGKSTLLDAIQLVLTTNTRRFNPAANEKSRRDLKGYVRCKTGEEGKTYVRDGKTAISYIALEFYEQSRDKYFVLGVKLDSPDIDSDISKKWFCEEGVLDYLSFVTDNKPSLDRQFQNNGRRVVFIQQTSEAKSRFKRRLGNLEDTFFDLIPKSLAFKPMDNVKSFITKFILPEKPVNVNDLRGNIRSLREMQKLIEEVKKQIQALDAILKKDSEIKAVEKDVRVIDILIKKAEYASAQALTDEIKHSCAEKQNEVNRLENEQLQIKADIERLNETEKEIGIAIGTNEYSRLIDKLKSDLGILKLKAEQTDGKVKQLNKQISQSLKALGLLGYSDSGLSEKALRSLTSAGIPAEERGKIAVKLKRYLNDEQLRLHEENAALDLRLKAISTISKQLEREIADLKKNKLTYPENTEALRAAIIEEFNNRGITGEVRVFADLLEITDPVWQNAVEGFLNTQRFALIVDPQNYDIAADVYDRMKDKIQAALLINTQVLHIGQKTPRSDSLAAVIKCENSYAKAYADYLLGRVIRCDTVEQLKSCPIAITDGCMMYQGKALRKIDERIYRIPFIGKYALKRQLEIKTAELSELNTEGADKRSVKDKNSAALSAAELCNMNTVEECLSAPDEASHLNDEIKKTMRELHEAEQDPTIVELYFKQDECKKNISERENRRDSLKNKIAVLNADIENNEKNASAAAERLKVILSEIAELGKGYDEAMSLAETKFAEHIRTKSADTVALNFAPRKKTLENQKIQKHGELTALQALYKNGENGTGENVISVYAEEAEELRNHEIIKCEEKLKSAKADCELEFRENFLAQMRENIDRADAIFKGLNKSLKSIYYGNDSYKFLLSAKKTKLGLYKMITAEMNVGGATLFTQIFEEQYHMEMEDLFAKLTESDNTGNETLNEYTDYREYLDYDIEIVSRDGKSQFFSKIYGEKSGGETQTPYYVAIAASFAQIYSLGDSIRIIMMDEAFDKMDDDRIASMMRFFTTQNFQIILATPPAKIEVIGEYVDTILMTYREGYSSIVEEYKIE